MAGAVDAAVTAAQTQAVKKLQSAAIAAVAASIPSKALLNPPTALNIPPTTDPLVLEAATEGAWGNSLRVRVDYDGIDDNVADRFKPLTKADLFNLTVRDMATGATERFLNLTVVKDSARHVGRVLENESNLIEMLPNEVPANRPLATDVVMDAAIDADASIPAAGKQKAKDDARKNLPFSAEDIKRSVGRSVGVAELDKADDGVSLDANDITEGEGLQDNKRGLYALDKTDLFNLLCMPPDVRTENEDSTVESQRNTVYQRANAYCVSRRAMLLVDPPARWSKNKDTAAATAIAGLGDLGLSGEGARNAAIFFPRVIQSDPTRNGQSDTFVPCGIVAGIMARTDTTRGVWKAPAGLDASLSGIQGLELNLNDGENGLLNPLGINCLRSFPVNGRVVWGARTLRGADQLADEYKYIPVRRTALFIEESLYRGSQWVVFEPNDEPLWAQIRLNFGAFMHNLFRQGAFQGTTPRDAYFVKCDKETTTQNDIDLGIVNIVVGFAPLKPAEFVVIKLQQIAGQIAV
ncbi:MAG: phage tail sheath subtilisin-like domain-containing protein [Verrucomicrobia bacterium]|nr:phage tail sheath subtilisin-like domain-containing protein [Verrucomicrobiota bacterium]